MRAGIFRYDGLRILHCLSSDDTIILNRLAFLHLVGDQLSFTPYG